MRERDEIDTEVSTEEETEDFGECPRCGEDQFEDSRYCHKCGESLFEEEK